MHTAAHKQATAKAGQLAAQPHSQPGQLLTRVLVLQVSIVPRGSAALGFAQYLPSENLLMTVPQMTDMMCMALGGRAAEQVMLGKISTGVLLQASCSDGPAAGLPLCLTHSCG